MSVKKTTVEAYRVSANGEWATIVVQGWQRPDGGASLPPMEQGEILIHSTYGSWGHYWTHLGVPVKQFLVGTSFDYFMGKMMRGSLREFDFAASLSLWKQHLVEARRTRQLTGEQFREVWDESCRPERVSVELFVDRLERSRPVELRDHPLWDSLGSYVVARNSSQAMGFWRDLWPKFIGQLRHEMTAANEPARHPAAA